MGVLRSAGVRVLREFNGLRRLASRCISVRKGLFQQVSFQREHHCRLGKGVAHIGVPKSREWLAEHYLKTTGIAAICIDALNAVTAYATIGIDLPSGLVCFAC